MSATKKMWLRRLSVFTSSPLTEEDQRSRSVGIITVVLAGLLGLYFYFPSISEWAAKVPESRMDTVTPEMITKTLSTAMSNAMRSCVKAEINREISRSSQHLPFRRYELDRTVETCMSHGPNGYDQKSLYDAVK
jgi:hypothetical protein